MRVKLSVFPSHCSQRVQLVWYRGLSVSGTLWRRSKMTKGDCVAAPVAFRASVTDTRAVSTEWPLLKSDWFISDKYVWSRKSQTHLNGDVPWITFDINGSGKNLFTFAAEFLSRRLHQPLLKALKNIPAGRTFCLLLFIHIFARKCFHEYTEVCAQSFYISIPFFIKSLLSLKNSELLLIQNVMMLLNTAKCKLYTVS